MSTETEYEAPQPVTAWPYRMKTTAIMEHSRGIAWTADLLREGVKIGTVEQRGDGGADWVYITDRQDRTRWEADVAAAFPEDGEEGATWYLLCLEEG